MKCSRILFLSLITLLPLACSELQGRVKTGNLEDEGLAAFRGVGVATLPERFDVEASGDARVEAFSARDADLRDTLLALFKDSEVNLLVESAVGGTASFDIKAASLEETFEALLESYDLAYRWDGDFLRVEGSEVRVFDVDYPGQDAAQLGGIGGGMAGSGDPSQGGGQVGAMGAGMGSGTGAGGGTDFWDRLESDLETIAEGSSNIVVNRRLGTVAIDGKPRVVRRVGDYIEASRRRATRQVSIEARIVEISLKNEFRAGVDWSILPGVFNTSRTGTLPGGAILGQSASSGAETFRFGLLEAGDFSVLLDALETQGQVRILSSPRIATLHNVPAQIRVVEQIPVIEREIIDTDSASRTQFTVRFEDAGVTVSVTPQIGEDGFITTHIMPSIVEVSGFVSTPDNLVTQPILNTRSMTTTLRVPDGQPIVLGGLRSERKTESLEKVPLLGDVPILGMLFRTTIQERADTELVIVLTPRILTSAWEREDWRRSLDRIRRIQTPFRPSSVAMNTVRIDPERQSLEGLPGSEAKIDEAQQGAHERRDLEPVQVKVRQVESADPTAKRISRGGLARVAFRRALAALEAGEVQRAIKDLQRATSLDGHCADAWLVLASVHFGSGRFVEAAQAYQRVLSLRPDDLHAMHGLGLVAMRRGDSLRAEQLFRDSLAREQAPAALNNLGVALLAQGRLAEARAEFERALASTSAREAPLSEAAINLGACLDRLGDVRGACEAYRAYVRAGGPLDDPGVAMIAGRVRAVLAQPQVVTLPVMDAARSDLAAPETDR